MGDNIGTGVASQAPYIIAVARHVQEISQGCVLALFLLLLSLLLSSQRRGRENLCKELLFTNRRGVANEDCGGQQS